MPITIRMLQSISRAHARMTYADKWGHRTSKCSATCRHFHLTQISWRKGNAKFPLPGLRDRACLCFSSSYIKSSPFLLLLHIILTSVPATFLRWSGRAPGGGCRGEGSRAFTPGLPLRHVALQITSDIHKRRAQFHNHCSALYQRQSARH